MAFAFFGCMMFCLIVIIFVDFCARVFFSKEERIKDIAEEVFIDLAFDERKGSNKDGKSNKKKER